MIPARKWSRQANDPVSQMVPARKWSRPANDPVPEMIPAWKWSQDPSRCARVGKQSQNRKWSPYWTANDPDQKIRIGMDGGIVCLGNWRRRIPKFLLEQSWIIIMAYNSLFSYCRLNFVTNYDAMNFTTQSSKLHMMKLHILLGRLNIDISVL